MHRKRLGWRFPSAIESGGRTIGGAEVSASTPPLLGSCRSGMHLKFGEKNTPEFEVWRLYEEFAQISQLFAKHSVITAGRGDDFRKFHGCLQNIKSPPRGAGGEASLQIIFRVSPPSHMGRGAGDGEKKFV